VPYPNLGNMFLVQYVPRQSSNYEDSFTATIEAERPTLRQ
jgi:hypothetical protein